MCVRIGFLSLNPIARSGLFTMMQINVLQSHCIDFVSKGIFLLDFIFIFSGLRLSLVVKAGIPNLVKTLIKKSQSLSYFIEKKNQIENLEMPQHLLCLCVHVFLCSKEIHTIVFLSFSS